jgi:hypothetical protein
VWETAASLRDDEPRAAFADVWSAHVRYPIVVGGGTPFLPPVTEDIPLDLIETRTFSSRVIFERYRRSRQTSD